VHSKAVLSRTFAGWISCLRDRPGQWEGECQPGHETKAGSEIRAKKAMAEAVNPIHCSQIPITQSTTTGKRTRKQGHRVASIQGVETAPRTPRTARPKVVGEPAFELVDMMLQTPMPMSPAANDFGPPYRDTTPAPLRKYYSNRHSISVLHIGTPLFVGLCRDPDCGVVVQVVLGLQQQDEQGRRKGSFKVPSRDGRVHGWPPKSSLTSRMECTLGLWLRRSQNTNSKG
jgi:hypothetical protein